jgi:putative FmdB family regulatory protein
MPIYEYECSSCGLRHEALQKLSDSPLTDCPGCGRSTLRKLVSAAGFRLSGGGWYETDFKKDGRRNLAEKDTKADKKDSKSGDAGKPAGKSEGKAKSAGSGTAGTTGG